MLTKKARRFLLTRILRSGFLPENKIHDVSANYRCYVWGDLASFTPARLSQCKCGDRRMDAAAVEEIEELFHQHGLSLGMQLPNEVREQIRAKTNMIVADLEADDRDMRAYYLRTSRDGS